MNVSQSTSTVASHIDLRPNRDGALRAYIAGTRVRVQEIVSDHERHGLSPEMIVREYPQLTLGQVYAALAFYYDHRDEVRADMKADEDCVQHWR
jgi:uncharacterized protein (DUF433 family)